MITGITWAYRSPAHRLCEELGIPYTLQRYDRDANGMALPLQGNAPMGIAPVITDGNLRWNIGRDQ
jgi:hypothetical protein